MGERLRGIVDTIGYLAWLAMAWVKAFVAWRCLPESRPSNLKVLGWFAMFILGAFDVMWAVMVLIE